MLSYQHIYHAGNLADVHKHTLLCATLHTLTQAPNSLTFIDTHAGRGGYPLTTKEAKKTNEAQSGYYRMLSEHWLSDTTPYMRSLKTFSQLKGKSFYPGSPLLTQHLLRQQDSLHLCELHPSEGKHLQKHLQFGQSITPTQSPSLHIYKEDGYHRAATLLKKMKPQHPIIFIDPSFEVKSEYLQAAQYITQYLQINKQAFIMLWYPLLPAQQHIALRQALPLNKTTTHEVTWQKNEGTKGMYGSGIAFINPPPHLLPSLKDTFATLSAVFDDLNS